MLKGLPYYGGKSPERRTCQWISSLLPKTKEVTYVEPFAGMLGVMLSRSACNLEIVNDASGWIVSWWKAIRDFPSELAHKIRYTPRSRQLFSECVDAIRNGLSGDTLHDGYICYVIISQSITHGINQSTGRWGSRYSPDVGTFGIWDGTEIQPLWERMREVQIENCDAINLLDRLKDEERSLIYVDPPYRTSDISPYGNITDWDLLSELLVSQKGRLAISGYNDEWDCTGFVRNELQTKVKAFGINSKSNYMDRVEVLWTNYQPTQTQTELFD